MARPLRIETTGASSNFKSGDYQYDSAGNIVKIGSDWYLYDARSRLVSSRVDDQPDLPGVDRLQSYTFDRYGNLGSTTTQVGAGAPVTRTSPAVTTTNRLSGGAYDAFGNVTAWSGQSYGWDVLRMMKSSPGRFLIYGPGDERIWEFAYTDPFNAATFVETYALRGLGGQVLREYKLTGGNATGNWRLAEEFVYRDGQLLASVTPTATTHFTLDHLGSPRLATGPTGTTLAYHAYYPFGEEATSPGQDAQRMKFTGHQRDYLGGGTTDDLDYMHARYGSPMTGRFLSVDPVLGEPGDPQSWNRYAYVTNNPVNSIDPDGRAEIDGCDGRLCEGSIEVSASLTLGDRVDRLAFNFSRPALTVMVGILNDSPTQVASGAAQTAGDALGQVAIGKFVTPVLAKIWAAFGAKGAAVALQARLEAIHGALDPIAQARRTTAILETSAGRVVASGARDLVPAQRALLEAGETAARLPGAHAEVTALAHALKEGMRPVALASTRAFCSQCITFIERHGGTITSPTTAIWP